MNSKTLTLFLLAGGLVLTGVLTRRAELLWLALLFLAYLGAGIFFSVAPGQVRLEAERSIEHTVQDGATVVDVCVRVSNPGQAIPLLRLEDISQTGMTLVKGSLTAAGALAGGGSACLEYTFRTERGSFAWETVRVVASDPLGLVETVLDLPAPGKIQVRPEVKRIRPFPIRSRRTLHSTGAIPARLGGSGTDFWGIREYHTGDSLRRLDWRRVARHPRALFTKEFEQEEIADIGLIVDARRRSDLHLQDSSLFEQSARAAASLAELFLRQGNRVSLLVHGTPTTSIFPGYGKRQLDRILRALASTTTENEGSLESLQFLPIQMFTSNSLILVISPLSSDDSPLFQRLRAHGYQALLVSPDPLAYARPMLAPDPLTGLAGRLVRVERQLEIRRISQMWIPVIDWQVNQPLAPLVREALSRYHIQRER